MSSDNKRPIDAELSEEDEPQAGPSTLTLSSSRDAAKTTSAKKKRKSASTPGIIYISRLPPGMTPHKVKHLMARWGEVGRVFAQARDGESSRTRVMCHADL